MKSNWVQQLLICCFLILLAVFIPRNNLWGQDWASKLISVLKTENPNRAEEVFALGMIGLPIKGTIPVLMRCLSEEVPFVWGACAHSLGKLGPASQDAVPLLIEGLNDKHSYKRWNAALALGRINSTAHKTIPSLLLHIKDPEVNVRWRVVAALGKFARANKLIVPALIEASRDPSFMVRASAIEFLDKMRLDKEEILPVLIGALEKRDPGWQLGNNAIRAMERFTPLPQEAINALIANLEVVTVGDDAGLLLLKQTSETKRIRAIFIRLLRHKDKGIRRYAARLLGKMDPKATQAIPALQKAALGDDDAGVQIDAALALRSISPQNKETAFVFQKLSRGPDKNARTTAIYYLRETKMRKMNTPTLIEALKDDDNMVRREAARKLGKMGSEAKAAIPHLFEILTDADSSSEVIYSDFSGMSNANDYRAKVEAGIALGQLSAVNKTVIPRLKKSAREKDVSVRAAAIRGLGEIRPAMKSVIGIIERALDDKEWLVRLGAVKALYHIGPDAKYAIPSLIRRLEDENTRIPSETAKALTRIGGPSKKIVTALARAYVSFAHKERQALYDLYSHKSLNQNSLSSLHRSYWIGFFLGKLGPSARDALPILLPEVEFAFGKRNMYLIVFFSKIVEPGDTRAIPGLISGLKYENSEFRSIAAQGLARIGPKAVPALVDVLDGPIWRAHRNAVEALEKIDSRSARKAIERYKREK